MTRTGSLRDPHNALVASSHSRSSEACLLALFTDQIQRAVAHNGYLAVFVLTLLGSACIPIPSEVVLGFAGALTTSAFAASVLGPGEPPLDPAWVVVWGVAGSLVGSWLAYALGAWGGRPAIDRWGRYLLLRPHEVDRAHDWFERRGDAVVFLGRFVPLVRAFVSLPAGVARMPLLRFSVFTFLGVLPWTFCLVLAGRLLGDRWHTIHRFLLPITIAAAAASVAFLVWWIRKRRRELAGPAGATPAP
jgi:membrane protein DedA with SNARE-associated domain